MFSCLDDHTAPHGCSGFPNPFSSQHSERWLQNAKLTKSRPSALWIGAQLLQRPKALHSLGPADSSTPSLTELQPHQPTSGPLLGSSPQPATLSPSVLKSLPS